jgi:hypothetical protein
MTDNTQLPAEVMERIDKEAEIANRKNNDRVNSYRYGYVAGYNDGAQSYATKARTLLEKVKSRHEAGLLPDRFIYDEIKTFLDGK